MGEIAEMMIEGSICQYCGEFLGAGDGFATSCSSCDERDDMQGEVEEKPIIECPSCNKTFKTAQGARQHYQAKHGM